MLCATAMFLAFSKRRKVLILAPGHDITVHSEEGGLTKYTLVFMDGNSVDVILPSRKSKRLR